jgi:hypothetical protein
MADDHTAWIDYGRELNRAAVTSAIDPHDIPHPTTDIRTVA